MTLDEKLAMMQMAGWKLEEVNDIRKGNKFAIFDENAIRVGWWEPSTEEVINNAWKVFEGRAQ